MTSHLSVLTRSVRSLTRTPTFATTVALTLALGIGTASATGVVARAVAFAGLPVDDASRVVVLWGVDRGGSFQHMPLGPKDIPDVAAALRGIAAIAAGDYNGAYPWPLQTSPGSETLFRMRGSLAGGNYFDVIGARPGIGRALQPEDDVIGAPRVMVLSHAAWKRHFGGDSTVIGRSLRSVIWGAPYTIVDVMPPGLDIPRGVEFWTAFAPTAARNGSLEDSWFGVDVVARLAAGATPEQARQALTAYYATLAQAGQTHWAGARATVRTLPELVTGDVRPAFAALGVAAIVVLLVTCGNVAGLLLVRANGRRRELAVRAALGAGRTRLIAELLGQHAVLAAAGGVIGSAIAAAAVRAFVALAPAELPRLADLGVNWVVLAAVAGVTTVVVLLVGVAPAIAATGVSPAAVLGGARDGVGGGKIEVRTRRMLVGAQVALALVVLTGAALVGRSLAHLVALDLGVHAPERLEFVELVPSSTPADSGPQTEASQRAEFVRWLDEQEAMLARLRATPGVVAVAPVVHEAYAGAAGWDARIEAEGAAPQDSARRPYVNMEITNADYLRVMGVPLLRGRWLADTDRDGAPRVVALSERAARALFPGADAVGRRVKISDGFATVVGVVGDTRFREFLEPRASVYVPYRQFDGGALFLAFRTEGMIDVVNATRVAVRETTRKFFVQGYGTLRDRLDEPLARPRLLTGVLGVYAILVVALAVAGLYAVVAGSVASRRREFGVRAAIGATPRTLLELVLREGLTVALIGAAVGLLVSLGAGRLIAGLLHGVTPADAPTLVGAVLTLLLVCVVAVFVPARRAATSDPAAVMRAD